MLRAAPDHPKFASLKAILGQPKGCVAGWLEMVWHFTGRFTPQGNIGKYPDREIEAWVEWNGQPGKLISALKESRWLDRDDVHRLLVHDWPQHADKATKNALMRAKLPFCKPTVRTEGEHVRTDEHESSTVYRLPEPEPEPESKANTPAKAKPSPDPRAREFKSSFQDAFHAANGILAPWDAKEASNLSRFLRANPSITIEQWQRILHYRSISPINQKASLSTWVARALSWLDAPADEWGKTVNGGTNNGYVNRAQARTNSNREAARIAADRLTARLTNGAG